MYAVSSRFLETLTGSHRVVSRARVLTTVQFGAAPTGGTELPILSGDVKLNATSDIKGTVELTVSGDYWDEVQPYGGELFVERGVDFGDGTREYVPLGYYRIDDVDQADAPAGPIRISAADRIAQMMQNRVLFPYQVPDGTTHRTIFERLVNGRLTPTSAVSTAGYGMFISTIVPIAWTGYDPDTATVPGGQVVEDSTYDFLAKLADGRGCVLRFDELGQLRIEPAGRDPDDPAVYAILPGSTGTLVRASRRVTRDGVYNIVSAYGSDPAAPTGYQLAYNNDVNSPLFWAGRFGPAPRYYASPVLRTDEAAEAAAETILARSTGLPSNLGLWAVPNPALRPLDVITARLGAQPDTHLIDTVTIPLAGDAPVEIVTRTVNPAGVVETQPDPTPTPDPEPSDDLPANPGELLWIGPTGGQNHFNIGIGGSSAMIDHSQAEIAGGYTEANFALTPDKRAVQFRVQVNAKTTSGSTYPRSELRELQTNGTSLASWNAGSGTHYMYGTTTVTHVAATKPWVCIAQIHDASDDVLRIQTEVVGGVLQLVARLNDVRTTLLPTYTVGTPIVWRIDVVAGALTVTINGSVKLTGTITNTGCYFKAGCYAQSNTSTENGDSSQYFSVELKSFVAWHTGYPAPTTPSYSTPPDPGPGPGPDPGNPNDGTQAAVLLGWGAVVDGDEFAYTGPPSSKWGMYNSIGHAGNGLRRPSAFSVANGILTCYGDAGGTTGGMAFRSETKYVRVEARCRSYSVGTGGHPYHPVLLFWPTSMGRVNGGEYDFYETNIDAGQHGWFMHYPKEQPKVQESGKYALDIQNWHNFAFEWSRNSLTGWVDGVQKWKYTDSRILSPDTMHGTIQLDNFYGSGMCPAKMEVAWYRIYNKPA